MVESKVFASLEESEAYSPPLVPVQAGEPVHVWHLQAVPVEPSAPSYIYDDDDDDGTHSNTSFSGQPIPTVVTQQILIDEPTTSNSMEDDQDPEQRLVVGAGVASGVIGLLLGGPFLGLILGFGAAFATKRDDAWGDSARAMGHVALTAQEQARTVNQKHNVVERSKKAARGAWRRAQELDRKHHIWDRTSELLLTSWQVTREFVQKHKLVERGLEGMGKVITWAVEQMQNKIDSPQHRAGTGQEQNPLRSSRS